MCSNWLSRQQSDSTIVFPAVALDSTPRFLACGQLGYPESLRRAGITGRVLVDLVIGRDGTPEHNNVWVEESADSGFDEDALAFVRSCHFTPSTRAGIVAYFEWGSRLAVINSQPGASVDPHAPMPRWGWGVPGGPYQPS